MKVKTCIRISIALTLSFMFSSFTKPSPEMYSLTIHVKNLRNEKGVVQFALYNKDGSIPDEGYKKFYKILKGEIVNKSSTITFNNIPAGKYAVNVLHDENRNGKIDKGFIVPVEGIGFSNYSSLGLKNRPDFSKSSFDLKENKSLNVKVIYF
ncbi:hypothetical protein BCY91_06705 [Pelobium manganitolerans]|uniref:DUF2141 domain-containing protein n=1 Tax=Pelobium manganitolerans TaxID=1842495 RepID=A0A419S549_9SPHI|nr:DUF2141 domain-containing protein [Pelobium manganitolerans]RKD15197.1 hypothetical protein BCY91_06705 [Pelobium manganitolerans]